MDEPAEPTSRRSGAGFDAVDERLIGLLRDDGRRSNRELARALGVSEKIVRSRLRRMADSNAMRVVAVTDIFAGGYDLMLSVGLEIEQRAPAEVAADLSRFPEIFAVNVTDGEHQVEVLILAEDHDRLRELLSGELSRIPGIRRMSVSLMLDVLKHQSDWVPLG
jgi:Lrp/AsnC family transcriptional regulator for asnA, asnC and gidA